MPCFPNGLAPNPYLCSESATHHRVADRGGLRVTPPIQIQELAPWEWSSASTALMLTAGLKWERTCKVLPLAATAAASLRMVGGWKVTFAVTLARGANCATVLHPIPVEKIGYKEGNTWVKKGRADFAFSVALSSDVTRLAGSRDCQPKQHGSVRDFSSY